MEDRRDGRAQRGAGESARAPAPADEALLDELAKQEHQYRAILDALPQMVWLKDTENRILCVNAAAAQSMGVPRSELEGRSEYDFHPRQAEQYYRDDLEIIRGAASKLDIVEPYEAGPDDLRWIRTDKTPYLDADGEVIGIVVSATDVTAWKHAEEERARLYAQLEQTGRQKTEFFANVSHELRTPLTLILGPVEKLLGAEELARSPSSRRELEVIRRNARVLLGYVNELLDVAKLDAGKVRLSLEPIEVDALVRGILAQFESVARDRRITVIAPCAGPAVARADAGCIQRVLANVLANAFRFTPDGGTVRCSVRVDPARRGADRAIEIQVADSGAGIEPCAREAIFERFRQADPSSGLLGEGRRAGTGLGLAIAKELVSLHRGTIEAGSAPEGGALFTIRLPPGTSPDTSRDVEPRARPDPSTSAVVEELRVERARPSTAEAEREDEGEGEATTQRAPLDEGPDRRERPLVLVVEDNPEMNRFIARELSDDYCVLGAFDGEEGLQLARATRPELVVSDVMMPRRDGVSLLGALRADAELVTVPVILLTARADEASMITGLGHGADDYLTKPFSSRELRARVRAHVELARMRRECATQKEEVARLHAAVKARDEFLSVASHELRTPLSTLQLNLQIVSRLAPRGARDPLGEARLEVATRACKQLKVLIDTLLDVGRIASGHMKLDRTEVDLAEVIADLGRRFEGEASASGSTLVISVDGPAVGVWDRVRIEQVLSNLLGNAIKFGEGKPIELGCTVDHESVHVTVRDHGVGIAEGDQERIFQRFEQAVDGRAYGGLGLGLWIAKDIVCRHQGAIHVASAPGAGSTFTVDLPRTVRGSRSA